LQNLGRETLPYRFPNMKSLGLIQIKKLVVVLHLMPLQVILLPKKLVAAENPKRKNGKIHMTNNTTQSKKLTMNFVNAKNLKSVIKT
jgi:hypothetical protein